MKNLKKPKILFVFRHEFEDLWRDGLWKAIQLLSYDFEITLCNLFKEEIAGVSDYDFILGWGAFNGSVDNAIHDIPTPRGLCIAGVSPRPLWYKNYDVLFYETDWFLPNISEHPNTIKAFGINTDIYKPMNMPKIWDYITVGAFALWKRQRYLLNKAGSKLAVGEVQTNNMSESMLIISALLDGGVMISNMVSPEALAVFYNMSEVAYIPADVFGGGERAVLEARACGIVVDVEDDNPKLQELVESPIYSHNDYYESLKKGIQGCL